MEYIIKDIIEKIIWWKAKEKVIIWVGKVFSAYVYFFLLLFGHFYYQSG